MNGFAYSIQTETASRRRESRSRGICLLNFPAIDLYRNVAVQKRIRQALNRLEELKSLPENWDENGALSIERRAYENTKCALEIIGEKASEAWNLFPNTNGTLLLTAPGKQLASINIGNENFSFFAMGKDKKVVKGMREFSPENLTNAFDQITSNLLKRRYGLHRRSPRYTYICRFSDDDGNLLPMTIGINTNKC